MEFKTAAAELLAAYQGAPDAEPVAFARTDAYRQFCEAAEQEGFTGSDVETDSDFAARSPVWVAQADDEALRRFVHTLIRCDRWNGDYPNAVWLACRSGTMGVLVERLAG